MASSVYCARANPVYASGGDIAASKNRIQKSLFPLTTKITMVMVMTRLTTRRGNGTKGKSTNKRTDTPTMNLVMRKKWNRNTKRKQKEIKQTPKR